MQLQTLVPFLRSKLDALHQQLQSQQQQQQQPPSQHPAAAATAAEAWARRCRTAALKAFVALYPWAAAAHEGARFAYQLVYLLGRSPYYSPGLHLLGLQVVRLTGQEAVSGEGGSGGCLALCWLEPGCWHASTFSCLHHNHRPPPFADAAGEGAAAAACRPAGPAGTTGRQRRQRRQQCSLALAPAAPGLGAGGVCCGRPHPQRPHPVSLCLQGEVGGGWGDAAPLMATDGVLSPALLSLCSCDSWLLPLSTASPSSQLLEWWYSSAEQRLGEQKALPPPPPPPPLPPVPPSAGGLALPADAALCPLCCRRRTNPTLVATSGYVFCYPCIHREVAEQGRCPVTHTPARLEHLRRLYQGDG